jgi:hypothetical protein
MSFIILSEGISMARHSAPLPKPRLPILPVRQKRRRIERLQCYVLYLLDNVGGNGISNIVGFLNLVFLLTFGFVLIGIRFYYSIGSSTAVSAVYIFYLSNQLGAGLTLYYLLYQIFTVFFCAPYLGIRES